MGVRGIGLSYELRSYDRNKTDLLAPPSYKTLHPMGIAPVITNGDLILGELGAIIEYLLAHRAAGVRRRADHPATPKPPSFSAQVAGSGTASASGCASEMRGNSLASATPAPRPPPPGSCYR